MKGLHARSKCQMINIQPFYFKVAAKYGLDWFKDLVITASNDINEETILSLNEQGHKITAFGIGTFAHSATN